MFPEEKLLPYGPGLDESYNIQNQHGIRFVKMLMCSSVVLQQ